VPVGLLGEQTRTSRVRSETASAIASRSCRSPAASGTCTDVARAHLHDDRVRLERPPGVDDLVALARHRLHDLLQDPDAPRPGRHVLGGTPKRSAMALTSPTANMSG
jgi:hypothetical protein